MNPQPDGPRIVSVCFPDLAIDRWRRITSQQRSLPGDDVPVVLSTQGTHGPVVYALSEASLPVGFCAGELPLTVQQPRSIIAVGPTDFLTLERGTGSVLVGEDLDGDGIPESLIIGGSMEGSSVSWALIGGLLAIVAKAKIGGQTGDILGAAQQLAEVTILVALIARI